VTDAKAVDAASTMNGARTESRRRPMPRHASMTDGEPGPGLAELTVSADDVLGPLLAATDGVRGWVDSWRYGAPPGRSPGVHPDVVTGAAHNTRPGDPAGEQLLDISGDERLVPGGDGEQEFNAKSARHRASTWPRASGVLVDLRDVREGRYGPAS
jgi:hypothetical protein